MIRVPGGAGGLPQQGAGDVSSWLDQLPVAAAILAPDGEATIWNDDAAEMMGWRSASHPRLGGPHSSWLRRLSVVVAREGRGDVVVSRRHHGRRQALRIDACRWGADELLILMQDYTQLLARRMRRAARARHGPSYLDRLSDVVRDHALLLLDSSGRVASWNPGAQRMTGYLGSEVMDAHVAVLLSRSREEVGRLLADAAENGRVECEIVMRRRDDSIFPAHITIARLGDEDEADFALVVKDLSEQVRTEENLRRSEEQLRHSQKMDAVGRLASGIAHDFNNVLTAIQGHVQFLLEDLPTDMAAREDAEEIRKAADRATELTRQLLTFGRKQPSRPVPVNPNTLIADVEKLLRRLIRADVTLDTMLDHVPDVVIDPGQLEQVIVNLVVNARDAIEGAGSITVGTSSMDLDEIYSARDLHLSPGQYVQVSVSDSGSGMSLETQSSIFEPFFTTKSEGTGLGLSTVYGIVKQAGGHISVYSEVGSGTTFKVFLPVHAPAETAMRRSVTSNGTGTVLLVEDDEAVRSLARRTLEGKGYAVVEAGDGEDALRIATTNDEIDVIVTDLMMPRLSGEELASRIRESRPDMGIVLMSGFSETSLMREGRIRQNGHFLEKPFTPNALVEVVRKAMPPTRSGDQSSTNST